MLHYDPCGNGVQETLGADLTNSRGTAVTPNASANTMGNWVSLGTSTFAYEMFSVMDANAAGSTSAMYACDIGIYDGTTYTPILSNWIVESTGSTTATPFGFVVPVHVPKGAQVGARVQSSSAGAAAAHLAVCGVAIGHAGQPGYSRGFNLVALSSTVGTACVSAAGANTKARTAVVASTLERAEALMCIVRTNNAGRSFAYDIEIGSAGNEAPLLTSMLFAAGATSAMLVATPTLRRSIPASSRLACNVQCTTGSSTLNVMPYGFA